MKESLMATWRATLIMVLAFMCGSSFAAQVAGVTLAERVNVAGHELVLNGAGLREKFFIKIYVVALYLPQKQTTPAGALAQQPRRIVITFVRDLTSNQVLESVDRHLTENSTPAELDLIKNERDQLTTIFHMFKDAKNGSSVALDYTPEHGTEVFVDGSLKGTIPGEAFNRALLKVWLGDHPPQADLKQSLLGG